MPKTKVCDLQCPPRFLVPLKLHAAPQGYECYMSCAVKGNPAPHVTWLRNNISLNTNTNYHITNTCGVCSLLILRVGPKDTGEYKIVAENSMGNAECSTKLTVRGNLEETFWRYCLYVLHYCICMLYINSLWNLKHITAFVFLSPRVNEESEDGRLPLQNQETLSNADCNTLYYCQWFLFVFINWFI